MAMLPVSYARCLVDKHARVRWRLLLALKALRDSTDPQIPEKERHHG
jgi:hypothetical protein